MWIGGTTDEKDESNYTHRELGGFADIYWNAATNIRFTIGSRIRHVELSDGANELRDVLPSTIRTFAGQSGIGGATVFGERFSVILDRRNQEFNTTSGTYARLMVEIDHGVGDAQPEPPSSYGRISFETRHYRSTDDQRVTLLLRNSWTFTTGADDIPFFELPTLGGSNNLRAFDNGRFYGRHSVFGSAELRFQAMHIEMMGFPMDLEIAPFVDFGQVFQSSDFEGDFNMNPGLSLRFVNRPNIGIVANGAVGQDGIVFTGGASLPF